MDLKPSPSSSIARKGGLGVLLLVLGGVLVVLFYGCFFPGYSLFSNDGPLGTLISQCNRLPAAFTGSWQDLNSVGLRGGGGWPSVTYALQYFLGPIGYAKFYAPLGLLLLGLGAWYFLRQLGLAPLACVLGGLAAALNSLYFSTACWGVVAHPIVVGMSFFAMGLLADTSSRCRWVRVALAGIAVGVGVADGADMGGIMSMFVAAYVMYQALLSDGPPARKLTIGVGRVGLVAVCAFLFAAQAITVLFGTQVQGVAGGKQDELSKQERWDFATQWSLPKREALSLVIPGLFGYRMDAPQGLPGYLQKDYVGANYWGAAGRDPAWDRYFAGGKQGPEPARIMRYSGGGPYAGILVALVGLWTAAQAFRRRNVVFTLGQRKQLWFWVAAAVASLLLAFGRFAPFYQFLFLLPYFKNIRNPAKFLEVFSLALIVLFAYGLDAFCRRNSAAAAQSAPSGFRTWWAKGEIFDRRWVVGCCAAFLLCVTGWLFYAAQRHNLEAYLQTVQFPETLAHEIAGFSINQVGWFLIFFAAGLGLFIAVLSGRFGGPRAKWAGVLLGLFLVVDLGRANLPWIIFVDYEAKNATNPVIDLLRQQPYEHRVAILPFRSPAPQYAILDEIYRIQWAQHQFQYYNVQSLDVVQMPRAPEDLVAFETALNFDQTTNTLHRMARRWQLTNTRYLMGAAGYLDVLNQQLDPVQRRFRIAARFNIGLRPGVSSYRQETDLTAGITPDGPFAVFEFTGALPRAKVYNQWQVTTNDQACLNTLASPQFDPEKDVMVNTPIPASTATTSTGNVSFVSYAPKDIKLKAEAPGSAVLLLNDRFDPNWKVFVDGKPQPLLRCNYIMRGVQLPAGTHQVEFRFEPPVRALYVSLAGVVVGLALAGCLAFIKDPDQERITAPPPRSVRENVRT